MDFETKREEHLAKAIEAEKAGNKEGANRSFRLAAYCDFKARGCAGSAKEYCDSVGDVL